MVSQVLKSGSLRVNKSKLEVLGESSSILGASWNLREIRMQRRKSEYSRPPRPRLGILARSRPRCKFGDCSWLRNVFLSGHVWYGVAQIMLERGVTRSETRERTERSRTDARRTWASVNVSGPNDRAETHR